MSCNISFFSSWGGAAMKFCIEVNGMNLSRWAQNYTLIPHIWFNFGPGRPGSAISLCVYVCVVLGDDSKQVSTAFSFPVVLCGFAPTFNSSVGLVFFWFQRIWFSGISLLETLQTFEMVLIWSQMEASVGQWKGLVHNPLGTASWPTLWEIMEWNNNFIFFICFSISKSG